VEWTFDTSYLYSPTFWLAPERYRNAALTPVAETTASGKLWWRRNRFDEVTHPTTKVMLFERFDFAKKRRPGASGAEDAPPQWNSPGASPLVATVDGGVRRVDMGNVAQLAADSNSDVRNTFLPSGPWNPTLVYMANILQYSNMNQMTDPYENGQNGTRSYGNFFWATRNGIRGRDFQR
jgi:hypothetical protein